MSQLNNVYHGPINAVLFDFMGTCLDWHSSIVAILPSTLPQDARSDMALEWRQAYFDANAARQHSGQAPEDIDITHRRVLTEVLEKHPDTQSLFTDEVKDRLVKAWHTQIAWPEVNYAIQKVNEYGWEVFVHANGTTRLQLDLPALGSYLKVLDLLKLSPEQCVMVAAHAYDLRGARAVGMKTVYVYRWTDDVLEDQEMIKGENDGYLNDMKELADTIANV